jgi:hypothetical protein
MRVRTKGRWLTTRNVKEANDAVDLAAKIVPLALTVAAVLLI